MAGGKKKKKKEKKVVDEYQLRRQLRAGAADLDEDEGMDESIPEKKEAEVVEISEEEKKQIRIAGIEGGGTYSTLVVLDGYGNKLNEFKGPNTNHWLLGMEETAARINAMIEKSKEELKLPLDLPYECLGLSLSGCEEDESNQLLVNTFKEQYPNIAKHYVLTSDTVGSIKTGLGNGGIVLIAGTGSNGLLMNPDGKTYGCGGWGHMLGDEGSAYWIAYRAIKYVYDDMDNFVKAPQKISYVWPALKSFFKISERAEILTHLYSKFEKSSFAMFAKEVAVGCERNDPLCLLVFEKAGRLLARHVVALSKKAHNDLKLANGGLNVICVGSVWKSWPYLKNGFLDEIHKTLVVDEFSLLRLVATPALGACYLAAEYIKCPFVKPYGKNVETFFHYKRDNYGKVERSEQELQTEETITVEDLES